jgi:hypothetical protein
MQVIDQEHSEVETTVYRMHALSCFRTSEPNWTGKHAISVYKNIPKTTTNSHPLLKHCEIGIHMCARLFQTCQGPHFVSYTSSAECRPVCCNRARLCSARISLDLATPNEYL